MDPDSTLAALRQITDKSFPEGLDDNEISTVVNLFIALDEWLSKGGFLPEAWQR